MVIIKFHYLTNVHETEELWLKVDDAAHCVFSDLAEEELLTPNLYLDISPKVIKYVIREKTEIYLTCYETTKLKVFASEKKSSFIFNPLLNKKTLNSSKLKEITDDKVKVVDHYNVVETSLKE